MATQKLMNVTAIFFPLLLTLTGLLSDRLMFVKALNLNSILCVEERMIYPPLKFHLFDLNMHRKDWKRLYLNLKALKCIWSTKRVTFPSVKIVYGQQVSGFLYLGNDCLSFTGVYKQGFTGSKQELQQQIYHREFVALINPGRSSMKHRRLCVSACFGLGRDSFLK